MSGPGDKLDNLNHEKPLHYYVGLTVEPEGAVGGQRDGHFEKEERVRRMVSLCHL